MCLNIKSSLPFAALPTVPRRLRQAVSAHLKNHSTVCGLLAVHTVKACPNTFDLKLPILDLFFTLFARIHLTGYKIANFQAGKRANIQCFHHKYSL